MNDLAELKQLRRIATAARRVANEPLWLDAPPSARYLKAHETLEAAVRAWEPEAEPAEECHATKPDTVLVVGQKWRNRCCQTKLVRIEAINEGWVRTRHVTEPGRTFHSSIDHFLQSYDPKP